ncbi:MAG TPA: BamA/TamA family outer membrane protein [Longimicrobiaceae bacterium]|nr:BamA/TamA family outer membrane protein [Longimicrobiaceae bacterium]
MNGTPIRILPLVLAACAAPLLAGGAAAQRDTTVVAGPRYDAGGLHRMFFGSNYRELWTAPVRVEVLNPETFAGGLRVTGTGGGLSTESVRMRGADGREYAFRSVDKNITPTLEKNPELIGTLTHSILQDLVSAKHPAGAAVVPTLLQAVGVLHAAPRLFVMPDHPFLGDSLRPRFAGRLGWMEERPGEEADGTPRFADARDIEGSDDLREKLLESAEHRMDARAYLTARLVDALVGDWDRHWDQWRWARFDRGELKIWRPIPRDRDNAFVSHRGLIASVARGMAPQMVVYGPGYGNGFGLIVHPAELDRRFLPGLSRGDWDAVAQGIRARLGDEVIDGAVRRLPPEYYAQRGAELAAALKARRDALPEFARWFYAQHAREVDLHATDGPERAVVTRLADGSVEVVVHSDDDAPGEPYYRRHFTPFETREVRIFLYGGRDRAVVSGASPRSAVLVRVMGGAGDDELIDESSAGGGHRTVFHDDAGDNQIQPGREARVDRREWQPPARSTLVGNPPPPRDWGAFTSLLSPTIRGEPNVGIVLGAGPTWVRYGFRRFPYASRVAVRALWVPQQGGLGAEATADVRHTNRRSRVEALARATNFETVRFHGFGNETPEDPGNLFEIQHVQVRLQAMYVVSPARGLELQAGPVLKWTDAERTLPGDPAFGIDGSEQYGQAGGEVGAELDLRDSVSYPRRGVFARAAATGFGSDLGVFGGAGGEASGYAPLGPLTLALRAGGQLAWGDFPFQESAFVGGGGTVRGYRRERFRGDAAVFGNAELRARLGRVHLLFVKPVVGVFALADAGRVYVDGDSGGDWHTGVGGGLSFEALRQSATVSYVSGERGMIYITFGMPF